MFRDWQLVAFPEWLRTRIWSKLELRLPLLQWYALTFNNFSITACSPHEMSYEASKQLWSFAPHLSPATAEIFPRKLGKAYLPLLKALDSADGDDKKVLEDIINGASYRYTVNGYSYFGTQTGRTASKAPIVRWPKYSAGSASLNTPVIE